MFELPEILENHEIPDNLDDSNQIEWPVKLATMSHYGGKPINRGVVLCRKDGFIREIFDKTQEYTPVEDFGMYIIRPITDEDFPPTDSRELFDIFIVLIQKAE